jgi:sterol desaturase/sphingolipid hydroxylase (fatty acid hydroxylase superfamily)
LATDASWRGRPTGAAVARHSDLVILTSDNPRHEDPERIIADILTGMPGTAYETVVDRPQAVARLFDLLDARPADEPWVWLFALLLYDFCYYWHHRAGHRVAVLWGAHVVHHQSEDYNLGTALRQTSSGFVFGWIFYLPMALAGVPPTVFAVVALIDLLYQFWVHTQQVGRLGWFDRWFVSPSNHRVHHAVNERYLDRNYGGILILWDRLFGTYAEEDDEEPVVYGTRAPLARFCPVAANLEVYRTLLADARHARRWRDKLKVWLMPPGWRPADVAARFPRPPFDIEAVRLYDPPAGALAQGVAALAFLGVLGATSAFLWVQHTLSLAERAAGAAAIVGVLWLIGRALEFEQHGRQIGWPRTGDSTRILQPSQYPGKEMECFGEDLGIEHMFHVGQHRKGVCHGSRD